MHSFSVFPIHLRCETDSSVRRCPCLPSDTVPEANQALPVQAGVFRGWCLVSRALPTSHAPCREGECAGTLLSLGPAVGALPRANDTPSVGQDRHEMRSEVVAGGRGKRARLFAEFLVPEGPRCVRASQSRSSRSRRPHTPDLCPRRARGPGTGEDAMP